MQAMAHISASMQSTMFRFLTTSLYPAPFAMRHGADGSAALRVFWLAQYDVQQGSHNETGNRHNPEHLPPGLAYFQKLRGDDRTESESEKRESRFVAVPAESPGAKGALRPPLP